MQGWAGWIWGWGREPGLGRGQSKGTLNTRPDSAPEKERQAKVCKAKKQPAGKEVMTGQWTRGFCRETEKHVQTDLDFFLALLSAHLKYLFQCLYA